ncbi:phage baseplate upper protein [Enterococcus sp. LJL128]
MTTYQMNLSTTEPNNYVGIIRVRQYDTESQTFDVTITENGVPVDFTGLTPLFYVRGNPNTSNWISEQKVTEIVDAKNGKLRYTLSHYDMQNLGKNKGYFAFLDLKEDGDVKEKFERTFQYSTKDFSFEVIKNAFSDGIHDSNYIWTFEEMLRYFMEWIKESQNTYDGWYEEAKTELQRIIKEFQSWISSNQDIYDEWLNENKNNFLDWFDSIRDILDENAAGNLLLLIEALEKEMKESHFTLESGEVGILRTIQDDNFSKNRTVEVITNVNDVMKDSALVITEVKKGNVFYFEEAK